MLDHSNFNFNAARTVVMCKIGVNTNMLIEQCALMHMLFGNDRYVGHYCSIKTNLVFSSSSYITCINIEHMFPDRDYIVTEMVLFIALSCLCN